MKICCLQMNMQLGRPRENFLHAEELIRSAMKGSPDVNKKYEDLRQTKVNEFFNREDKDSEEIKEEVAEEVVEDKAEDEITVDDLFEDDIDVEITEDDIIREDEEKEEDE